MVKKLLVLALLGGVGCASISRNTTSLGPNRFLITCDGNGYTATGATAHCLAEEAAKACEGKQFKFLESSNYSQHHVGVNLANGSPVPHQRPHGMATVECF